LGNKLFLEELLLITGQPLQVKLVGLRHLVLPFLLTTLFYVTFVVKEQAFVLAKTPA
jgi:hypothetical protein